MRKNLILEVRRRIRSGEFSERALARKLGISQPHVHNVLAGIREVSVEMADRMVVQLMIPLERLLAGLEDQAVSRIISSMQR